MTTEEILAQIPRLRALVVGDVCLDRWCRYDPAQSEPSRETGIPRIGVVSTEVTPGAAGTIANNLAALGCGHVAVLGAAGDDGFGWELDAALRARRIDPRWLLRSPALATFTYTKLINAQTGAEDLPRVDFINTQPLAADLDEKLTATLREIAAQFDVTLVSDQAETGGGVVTAHMRDALASLDNLVWVDSRKRCELFRNVILKPNREEADAASRRIRGCVDYKALREHTCSKLLVVTHGPQGAQVIDGSGETWVPATANEHPVDIFGAGDSFSAGAALALKITGSPVEAARFGNRVAAVTIMKEGTGTASPEELL